MLLHRPKASSMRTTEAERRAKVAEACLGYGTHLLKVRPASESAGDASAATKDLFNWFGAHNAFSEANHTIAVGCIDFGRHLLEFRRTTTPAEAMDAIEDLFESLALAE